MRLHAAPSGITDLTPAGAVATQRIPSSDQVDLATTAGFWGTFWLLGGVGGGLAVLGLSRRWDRLLTAAMFAVAALLTLTVTALLDMTP